MERRYLLAFNVRIIASLSVFFTEAILYMFASKHVRIIPFLSNLIGLGLTSMWTILLDFIKFPLGIVNKKIFTVLSFDVISS